jgi:hypothetical protein
LARLSTKYLIFFDINIFHNIPYANHGSKRPATGRTEQIAGNALLAWHLPLVADTSFRYLVGDDPGQAVRARRLIDNNDVFVCTSVLLETEWVLRSVYGFPLSSAPRPSPISRD